MLDLSLFLRLLIFDFQEGALWCLGFFESVGGGPTAVPRLGDGTSPGKPPELGLCGDGDLDKGLVARESIPVSDCYETTAMDTALTHGVDLDGNMDDSDMVNNNRTATMIDSELANVTKSGDEGKVTEPKQINSTEAFGVSEVDLAKMSFRDIGVGKSMTASVVSEIPELDILIGDDDVRFGVQDDGRRQKIEYEGLPTICYHCGKYGHLEERCLAKDNADGSHTMDVVEEPVQKPVERYGPWMQVAPRKNRRTMLRKEGTRAANGGLIRDMAGNRFDALRVQDGEVDNQGDMNAKDIQTANSLNGQQAPLVLKWDNSKGKGQLLMTDKNKLGKEVVIPHEGTRGVRGMSVLSTKDMGQSSDSGGEARNVQKHGSFEEQAVSLEENIAAYGKLASMEQITERRLTRVKGFARKAPYPQRKAIIGRTENQLGSKVNVEGWIGDLSRDLSQPDGLALRDSIDIADTHEDVDGKVHWRSNLAFAGDGLSKNVLPEEWVQRILSTFPPRPHFGADRIGRRQPCLAGVLARSCSVDEASETGTVGRVPFSSTSGLARVKPQGSKQVCGEW
ncbi:hypothetical protein V6N13_091191 [Hibiscus sabdariffa]